PELEGQFKGIEEVAELEKVGPMRARQAAAEAGATSSATWRALGGMNPISGEPQFAFARPGQTQPVEGIAPRIPEQGGGGGPEQNARIAMADQMFDTFKKASESINVAAGPGQLWEGFKSWAEAKGQVSRDPVMFDRMRGALAATLLAAISGAQASDRERDAVMQILPDFTTRSDVAEDQLTIVSNMINAAKSGPITTPENRLDYILTALTTGQLPGSNTVSGRVVIDLSELGLE